MVLITRILETYVAKIIIVDLKTKKTLKRANEQIYNKYGYLIDMSNLSVSTKDLFRH